MGKKKLINKYISWVNFNMRVLQEAKDSQNPILEKAKFLSISGSNFDEFFMTKAAKLKAKNKGILFDVLNECKKLFLKQEKIYFDIILPGLEKEGIYILDVEKLKDEKNDFIESFFKEQIYPLLTPVTVDETRPHPLLESGRLYIGAILKSRDGLYKFAIVKVPQNIPRVIKVDEGGFCLVEDIIKINLDKVFFGFEIESSCAFRLIKRAKADLPGNLGEDGVLNFTKMQLLKRPQETVLAEVENPAPGEIVSVLEEMHALGGGFVIRRKAPLDFTFLEELYNIMDVKQAKFKPHTGLARYSEDNIFEEISKADVLLHYPFDSFSDYLAFLKRAAYDKDVLAIKITLYRIGEDSPIIPVLIDAAKRGKQVTVVIELKAKFDEETNYYWACNLEKAGCHVVYGPKDLKVHCKITLVLRKEGGKIARFSHICTGNYNEKNAKTYTDIGIFTKDEETGKDVGEIFNMLSGLNPAPKLKKLCIAPFSMRDEILGLIDGEIKNAKAGKKARIIAKMNSLLDKKIIQALYHASSCGVRVDLIVRGVCALVPEDRDFSGNITVKSVVGRFLEHSRVFYFYSGGKEKVFISSADWMKRNLDRRIEVMMPVLSSDLKRELTDILNIYLKDDLKSHYLKSDATYEKRISKKFSAQDELIKKTNN